MTNTTKTTKVIVAGDSTGAQKALGDLASKSQSTTSQIKSHFQGIFTALNASGALAPFQQVLETVGQAFDSIGGKASTMKDKISGLGIGMAGAGAALTVIGSNAQQTDKQLSQAFTDAGSSMEDFKGQIDETVKKNENFGISANDSKQALQQLVQATGDPTKALGLMGDAANLAAARHESLQDATTQLIQVMSGKGTRTLAEFGITQQQVKQAAKDHTTALDLLSKKIDGQASASVDSFKGKLDVLKTKIEDHVEVIGQKYGPAISAVGVGLTTTMKVAELTQSAITALKGAQEAGAVAAEGMAGAEVATEAASLPLIATIGLVVLAVAAVGAAVYELVTHWSEVWGTIKQVVADAWKFIDTNFVHPIEDFFSTIVNFIKSHWELILAIITGPIGLAVLFIKNNFNDIVNFFTGIPGRLLSALGSLTSLGTKIIGDVLSGVTSTGHTIWDWFTSIPGKIISAIGDLAHIGEKIVSDIVKGVASMGSAIWDEIKKHIPGSGVVGGALNAIGLAEGGVATKPTLALIAEAGYPEAVIPLKNGLSPEAIAASVNAFFGGGQVAGQSGTDGGGSPTAATTSVGGSTPGAIGGPTIYQTFITPASASDIANETMWALKVQT